MFFLEKLKYVLKAEIFLFLPPSPKNLDIFTHPCTRKQNNKDVLVGTRGPGADHKTRVTPTWLCHRLQLKFLKLTPVPVNNFFWALAPNAVNNTCSLQFRLYKKLGLYSISFGYFYEMAKWGRNSRVERREKEGSYWPTPVRTRARAENWLWVWFHQIIFLNSSSSSFNKWPVPRLWIPISN